jgi:hypothetical protein
MLPKPPAAKFNKQEINLFFALEKANKTSIPKALEMLIVSPSMREKTTARA